MSGQKTTGTLYDTLAIPGSSTAGSQLQFFQQSASRQYPVQTNMSTGNKLDDGFFQVIEYIKFAVFTQTAATAAVTAINDISQAATTVGLVGACVNIVVNQGIVVSKIPLTTLAPAFNPYGIAANAVADTTGLVITKQGHSYIKLENPLVLLPQTPFVVQLDLPIYTGAATLFLRCELSGLAVVPNPSKI
jgi:hypothetical protein